MDVITISRQLGSLGFQVGKTAAEQLNYRLVWRDLINQAAILAGAPEVALAMFDEFNLLGIEPTVQQFNDYVRVVNQVIREMAQEGGIVIIGRAGQVLLHDEPRALHVRIIAPLEVRVARVSETRGVTAEAANAQIQASDRSRRNYLRRFYHTDWDDPLLYDLVLNTEKITAATAAESICQAARLQPEKVEVHPTAQEENP